MQNALDLTAKMDGAMVCVVLFVGFFAWLVFFHLRVEDKREGYPRLDGSTGILPMPNRKRMIRPHGRSTVVTPRATPHRDIDVTGHGEVPLRPRRDGLVEGIGPAAWAAREDVPDLNKEGQPKMVSISRHSDYSVAPGDPDPTGWPVYGADGVRAGKVVDLWFNRAEFFLRYFEIRLDGGRNILCPLYFAVVDPRQERVTIRDMPGARMIDAPGVKGTDRITMLEEDKINAFFAGAKLYGSDPTGRGDTRRSSA